MSNRFNFIDREHIHGVIRGVDYGYNLSCLIRSPSAALLWSSGTAYTSGRQSQYGSSGMFGIHLTENHGKREYKRFGEGGGRLSYVRIMSVADEITELFQEDLSKYLPFLIKERQTLLIEGGGEAFEPSRRLISK